MSSEKSNTVKEIRKELGYTQQTLADSLGIPLRTYQDYEKTGSIKSPDTLRAYSDLGINPNYLLGVSSQMFIDVSGTPTGSDSVGEKSGYTDYPLSITLTNSQQFILAPVIRRVEKIMSENQYVQEDSKTKFMIVAQLRVPYSGSVIDEPTLYVLPLTGTIAELSHTLLRSAIDLQIKKEEA